MNNLGLKILIGIVITLFLVLILDSFFSIQSLDNSNHNMAEIIINDLTLYVEISQTDIETRKGLSNREKLEQDHGMLFVFDNKKVRTFWMKDMKFPLDMIWIEDNKIVDISKNVQLTENNSITRKKSCCPVNLVLEVNAGYCDQHDIKAGDEILLLR